MCANVRYFKYLDLVQKCSKLAINVATEYNFI